MLLGEQIAQKGLNSRGKLNHFFNIKFLQQKKTMEFFNYETGIEHMFQFLRPKEFVIYATLNKTAFALVKKYFVVRKMLSLKINGYSPILDIPKHTLFKITLGRSCHPIITHPSRKYWNFPVTFIFRPISMKNCEIFGWIISGNGMLKTGGKYKPYPWRLRISLPYNTLEGGTVCELPLSKCSAVIQVIGRNPRLTPLA